MDNIAKKECQNDVINLLQEKEYNEDGVRMFFRNFVNIEVEEQLKDEVNKYKEKQKRRIIDVYNAFNEDTPNEIKKIKMDGKAIPHEVVRSTNIFFIVYVLIFASSIFLIAFDDFNLITNFTAVAATFNNIGPGLELVGPTGNFGMFSWFSKLILTFDMLAGRLEIFPLLILFVRDTWKKF